MRRVDGYSAIEQVTCVWEGSTLIVSPESFAIWVAGINLPDEVPSFVPSSIEPAVVTTDPVVQWFTSLWLIDSYFDVASPDSPIQIESEGFPDFPEEPVKEGVIN